MDKLEQGIITLFNTIEKKPNLQASRTLYDVLNHIYQQDRPMYEKYINRYLEDVTNQLIYCNLGDKAAFYTLRRDSLRMDSYRSLDSYLQFLEYDRDPEKMFYVPRREIMKPIVQSLQDLTDDKLDLLSLSMPPGTGKAQPLDALVLTPGGFKEMGEIRLGDIVYSMTGKATRVVGVFPQGVKDVYRITFESGRSTEACGDHLWHVKRPNSDKKWRVLTTDQIRNNPSKYPFAIPKTKPVEFVKQDLPVDPLKMGKFLGCHFQGTRLRGKFRELGLDYRISPKHKFIPPQYLRSSIDDRYRLLQGLLDYGNGTRSRDTAPGRIFTTASYAVAQGICDLVYGLGGMAYMTVYEGRYQEGMNGRLSKRYTFSDTEHYKILIQFHHETPIYFEKRSLWKRIERKHRTLPVHEKGDFDKIVSVEHVGQKECQCIKVSSPTESYLTNDFIVTHNTTLGTMYLSWIMGREPMKPNLASAHSSKLTRSFFDGVQSIITDPEYNWEKAFPNVPVVTTSTKEESIDLMKEKRFKTLTCRSIDGSLTGATRCENILYADDLVSGIEEAMSLDRMESLWMKYANDLKSRKKQGCKEIHIATRWSVHDVIGRLERQYGDDPRAKFIAFPALDENDESNFNYKFGVGFDTKYYRSMRNDLDNISWKALYQNEPIEREGLLYNEDELRRYYRLPEGDPDAILAICDTAESGKDDTFLPVAYQYGSDFYIEDCVCTDALPEVTDNLLAHTLVKHRVHKAKFESNSAGGRTADKVQELVDGLGGRTHIVKQFTTSNKETKIIVNSDFVKKHFLFKDKTQFQPNSQYAGMVKKMCSYSLKGKNKHDDVPDGLAQLAEFINSMQNMKVSVFQRPF